MDINSYIDHSNLKATATVQDIEKLCKEAIDYHFYAVCVHPYYVPFAKKILEKSTIQICTVVGFPLGMSAKDVKVYEAIEAVNEGADEIELVMNIGAIKDHDYAYIQDEIEEVRDAIDGKVLTVIIDTCYLTEEEIRKIIEICNHTYVHFIKTSTGFENRSTSKEDINIVMKYKNDVLELKSSGNVDTYEEAISLIEQGVTRIEASSSVDICHATYHKEG